MNVNKGISMVYSNSILYVRLSWLGHLEHDGENGTTIFRPSNWANGENEKLYLQSILMAPIQSNVPMPRFWPSTPDSRLRLLALAARAAPRSFQIFLHRPMQEIRRVV
jgi:hypothetical protein